MAQASPEHPEMCEHEHCHCSEHGIFRSALSHTIQITVFLVVISIVLGFVMEELQANGVSSIFGSIPGAGGRSGSTCRHDTELCSLRADHTALYQRTA